MKQRKSSILVWQEHIKRKLKQVQEERFGGICIICDKPLENHHKYCDICYINRKERN